MAGILYNVHGWLLGTLYSSLGKFNGLNMASFELPPISTPPQDQTNSLQFLMIISYSQENKGPILWNP